MIIGSSSRLVAGKKAVQTVYWRVTQSKPTSGGSGAANETNLKIYKTGRTFTFDKNNSKQAPPSNFEPNSRPL
ncbi:hypothetical protein WDU94_012547 [Cyamophila willieti]